MKKILFFITASVSLAAQAQTKEGKLSEQVATKEGKVIYERTVTMANIRFGGGDVDADMPREIREQLAKPRVDQFELLFTPQHSIYQSLPNAADEGGGTFSGGGMVIQMRGMANDVSYVDFAAGTRVDQREIMQRSFVVTDTLARLQWKLSDETKPILNFTARKATATTINPRTRTTMENGELKRETVNDTVKVVAWYTTDVPVPAGPNYAGQLPGLILELDVNNGRTVIKAIEFSPKVSAKQIKAPSDGKKITAAEFATEREKIMEEMRKNMPSNGVIRMQ